ncbi:MAG TPA: 50S ribosomal protein L18Ae [Thermoplasmata archaeon]|nr:50S ribosomal protein L18Ae [Thermoplasmata archaeon]HYB77383.1 50S ribosomal protein L18Ae [Thermoplasmata archaeon]
MVHFKVQGSFYARRNFWQPFTKVHDADSADLAREWALSEIGGCHHVKRSQIRIDSVAEVQSA